MIDPRNPSGEPRIENRITTTTAHQAVAAVPAIVRNLPIPAGAIYEIVPEYCELIPDELEEGIIYISLAHKCAIHLCACGCKNKTVTPLKADEWILTDNNGKITLRPSIGNFSGQNPHHAHYLITDNKIEWHQEAQAGYDGKKFIFKDVEKLPLRRSEIVLEKKKEQDDGVVYVCNKWQVASLKCPCGCGEIILISLLQGEHPCWKITGNTIHPSINRIVGCMSHFTITNGVTTQHP